MARIFLHTYTESDIENALKDVTAGGSQRLACKRWGLPRSTLQRRLKGSRPMHLAKEHEQRLTRQQEKHLHDWVLTQDALGLPAMQKQLTTMVQKILSNENDLKPLGKHWVDGFLRRHPEIKSMRGKELMSVVLGVR